MLPDVPELTANRVGHALRKMAEDLVAERRRAALLTRENRELRTQLESLQRSVQEQQRRFEANSSAVGAIDHPTRPG
jgi:hypothetical protein